MPATVASVLADARDRLTRAGSPTPRLDAEVLLAHVLGRDRSWLLAHPEAAVDEVPAWIDAVERRATGEPIAYIRGFKEWRSLRIRVDRRVLVPRPETELLADEAIREVEARLESREAPVSVREVATGSGAVAVALARRFRDEIRAGRVVLAASDVSGDALAVAADNLEAHGVSAEVRLVETDLLGPAGDLPRPDVLVANLPYVPSAEVTAAAGSLAHEPALALDGGPDGLDVVRRLLASLPGRLAPGAAVLLEIGAGQAQAVRELAPLGASVEPVPDLAGIERVVRIGMADSSA